MEQKPKTLNDTMKVGDPLVYKLKLALLKKEFDKTLALYELSRRQERIKAAGNRLAGVVAEKFDAGWEIVITNNAWWVDGDGDLHPCPTEEFVAASALVKSNFLERKHIKI